jgi:hypothetical protein
MNREHFAAQLAKSTSPRVRNLAQDLSRGACWGNLADAWDGDHHDRLALWRELVDVGDREPLLLFLWLHRENAELVHQAAKDALKLPPTIQCALVCMGGRPEPKGLHPGARDLLAASADARARELVVYAAHAEALRAHRIPNRTPEENE